MPRTTLPSLISGVEMTKKGIVHLYTGTGGGKTTSTLGVALRAVGHKQKVIMIQFMKGRKNTGEYKIRKKLSPYFEIHQFGRPGFVDLKKPSEKDKKLAQKGLEFARKALKKKPNVLILDEINIATRYKLIDVDDVLDLLKDVPSKTTVYLTGRYAMKKLVDRADIVNKIMDHKYPKKFLYRKGIEY